MYIEYKDLNNIVIKITDEEKAIHAEALFVALGNAAAGIVWEIARYIAVDEDDVIDTARKFSDVVNQLVHMNASKLEYEKDNSVKATEVEEVLYSTMEQWYKDFIKEKKLGEDVILGIVSKMQKPRLSTSKHAGRYYFDIKSDDRIKINIGTVEVDASDNKKESERAKCSAIAVVLFDKVFKDIEKHPMRGEGSQMFFKL